MPRSRIQPAPPGEDDARGAGAGEALGVGTDDDGVLEGGGTAATVTGDPGAPCAAATEVPGAGCERPRCEARGCAAGRRETADWLAPGTVCRAGGALLPGLCPCGAAAKYTAADAATSTADAVPHATG
ncbi:MAG TPA: hypothetical protein DHU96_24230 [Actinobacteria bacterium]|nr:hypothetical protein [Actinomycetota bacterium]